MTLRRDQEVASASEGSAGGAWVCDNDPAHVEGVSAADDAGLSER